MPVPMTEIMDWDDEDSSSDILTKGDRRGGGGRGRGEGRSALVVCEVPCLDFGGEGEKGGIDRGRE